MRILHLLNHIEEIGNGIVNVTVDLACTQARGANEVCVASAGGRYEALLARYGVRHFDLDQTRNPSNLFKVSRRYLAIVRELRPDIVHVHMMTGAVIGKGLKGGAGYSLVATVHNAFQRSSIL